PGPFFASVCLAAPLVLDAGSNEQKHAIAGGIATGDRIATVAYTEALGRLDAGGIELTAREEGGSYVLQGTKQFVLDAHVADTLLVAARTSSGEDPADGITLFVIDAAAPGVAITQQQTMDSTRRWCEVAL